MADEQAPDDGGEFLAMPGKPFYIIADRNCDGSLDIDSEGKTPMELSVALDQAKLSVEEHGGTEFVIECRAIRRISRGKLRIATIKTR